MLTLTHFLVFAALLFVMSVLGIFLNQRNILALFMATELMLLAVNFNFLAFAYYLSDLAGQIVVLFTLTVAAAELAVGLAIVVLLFRRSTSIHTEEISQLKG